jgi:glutathione S-transferase
MLTVYGAVRTRTLRVLWLLEELGLDFAHVPAPPRSAEVRALNPSGKVPVLVVNGTALTDSTAILQFLADREGRFTHPAGTIDRARQDSLTQFLLDEIEGPLWAASRHSFILPEELRIPAIKDTLRWEFARSLAVLATRTVPGGFLCGPGMTVPDVILTHCGIWAEAAKFPITEPVVADYLARMLERPALQRARAR